MVNSDHKLKKVDIPKESKTSTLAQILWFSLSQKHTTIKSYLQENASILSSKQIQPSNIYVNIRFLHNKLKIRYAHVYNTMLVPQENK